MNPTINISKKTVPHTFTANGTYAVPPGLSYDPVTVAVEGGGTGPVDEELIITENGTIRLEDGVRANPIIAEIPVPEDTTKTITNNGTYHSPAGERWGTVVVNVEGGASTTPFADSVKGTLLLWLDGILNNGEDAPHSDSVTTWSDLSGNGNNGAITSGAWGEDHLIFDGATTWVNCGEQNPGNFTFEVCFDYQDEQQGQFYVVCNEQNGGFGIWNGGAEIYVSSAYRAINHVLPTGSHVAHLSYDNKILKYYIDGDLLKTLAYTGHITDPQNNTVLAIGVDPNGSDGIRDFFKGKVYSFRLWNCGFSDAVVAGLAAETMERFNIGGTT